MVERDLAKVEVASSNLVSRSKFLEATRLVLKYNRKRRFNNLKNNLKPKLLFSNSDIKYLV